MPREDTRLVHLPQPTLLTQVGSSPPSWPGGEDRGLKKSGLRSLHSLVPAASFSLHPHPHPGGTLVSAFEWKRTGLKRHSTCENHAYAATQLVRKRQRANQQASGSRSPQRSPTVQSRRADARGILEAEEGGEESDFAHVFLA